MLRRRFPDRNRIAWSTRDYRRFAGGEAGADAIWTEFAAPLTLIEHGLGGMDPLVEALSFSGENLGRDDLMVDDGTSPVFRARWNTSLRMRSKGDSGFPTPLGSAKSLQAHGERRHGRDDAAREKRRPLG